MQSESVDHSLVIFPSRVEPLLGLDHELSEPGQLVADETDAAADFQDCVVVLPESRQRLETIR